MNSLVLSGTAAIVPSGTGSTCYQGPELLEKPSNSGGWRARNFSRKDPLDFLNGTPESKCCGSSKDRTRLARDRLAHRQDREAHANERRPAKRAFAACSSDADTWVRTRQALSSRESEASPFTSRLTIDVTLEQRGRIKVTAFRHGQTVADMLRELLPREFPDKDGDPQ